MRRGENYCALVGGVMAALLLTLPPRAGEAQSSSPTILAVGETRFLPQREIEEATGARLLVSLDSVALSDVTVVVLANISYTSLPLDVQSYLVEFVRGGGSLFMTGGPQAYGSGGYAGTPLGEILPLAPRAGGDWSPHPFGPAFPLTSHPILEGVAIPTVALFNDLDLKPGAVEILQYRKALKNPVALIAEGRVGSGTVLALALDMSQTGQWPDRNRFVVQTLTYLLNASRR